MHFRATPQPKPSKIAHMTPAEIKRICALRQVTLSITTNITISQSLSSEFLHTITFAGGKVFQNSDLRSELIFQDFLKSKSQTPRTSGSELLALVSFVPPGRGEWTV